MAMEGRETTREEIARKRCNFTRVENKRKIDIKARMVENP